MGNLITQERAKYLFDYDFESGQLIWKNPPAQAKNVKVGDVAGTDHGNGYLRIGADKRGYKAHRLIWLYVNGVHPSGVIDHIDHDKKNNRIENLRDVSLACNRQNMTNKSAYGASPLLGVSFDKSKKVKKWRSAIMANGIRRTLGYFLDQESAHEAYVLAKRQLHEGCTI